MNSSQKTSYLQVSLILGALAAGGLMTLIVPERIPLAGYVQQRDTIPTTAVFKSASAKKASLLATVRDAQAASRSEASPAVSSRSSIQSRPHSNGRITRCSAAEARRRSQL